MREYLRNIIILGLLVLFCFFFFTRAKPVKIIRLAGSTAFLPFAEKLAEIYMEKHPEINIDVQGGGSAVGIMAAASGIVDIGMVDMISLPKEVEVLEKVVVARDGIAVIINTSNKIDNLTISQLKGIFSGNIKNWKDLRGDPGPIRVISREEGSGTRKSFDQLVLSGERLSKEAMYQDSNGSIREAVKADPKSISYISIGFLSPETKPLKISSVKADNDNVKTGKYNLARPIYFILKTNPNAETRNFMDYILGYQAQGIIETDGLISVK